MDEKRETVFISYSHHDSAWLDRLHVMLKPLTRSGSLDVWDDTKISPGRPWQEEIENALQNATIAVLLVTPRFLASEFIDQNELPPLLEAAERRGLKVFWIAVSASLYTESPIARFQAVNDPSKPLDRYLNRPSKLNDELLKIAQIIKAGRQDVWQVPEVHQIKEELSDRSLERRAIVERKATVQPKPIATRQTFSPPADAIDIPSDKNQRKRILILMAGVLIFAGLLTAFFLRSRFHVYSSSLGQQSSNAGPLLTDTSLQNLNQARKGLTSLLEVQMATMTAAGPNPDLTWTLAQMAVALEGLAPFDQAAVARNLLKAKDKDCNCWKEYGREDAAAVSSWTLFALSKIQSAPEQDELKYLLDSQKADGAWSIAPSSGDPSDSGTYATSWAVLVLNEYRLKHRIRPQQQVAVDQAIGNATRYLLAARIPGKARWRDYPQADDGLESISDSALTLHALHEVGAADPAMDRLWLQTLPGSIEPMESENSGHRVRLKNQSFAADSIRRYKLPWCLIATKDAYASGSTDELLATQQWINRVLSNASEIERVTAKAPHVAAEYLIALRYLDGDNNVL